MVKVSLKQLLTRGTGTANLAPQSGVLNIFVMSINLHVHIKPIKSNLNFINIDAEQNLIL